MLVQPILGQRILLKSGSFDTRIQPEAIACHFTEQTLIDTVLWEIGKLYPRIQIYAHSRQ